MVQKEARHCRAVVMRSRVRGTFAETCKEVTWLKEIATAFDIKISGPMHRHHREPKIQQPNEAH